MKFRRNKKGFTIVELVIVIGVIGILSAILIPTFVGLNEQADRARVKANLHNAFSLYAADAVDGKVGEDGVALAQKDQSEILIGTTADGASGTLWYHWSTSGEWDKMSTAPTSFTAVSNPNQKYLSYYMFY